MAFHIQFIQKALTLALHKGQSIVQGICGQSFLWYKYYEYLKNALYHIWQIGKVLNMEGMLLNKVWKEYLMQQLDKLSIYSRL